MIKILLGGSPCTHWSIAQSKNRETEASGQGWELFKNYLIAKEKFKPDFFLYENNKSAAAAIKNQISKDLGVDLMYINSALVSAQNRQRFYCFNGECEQPNDRGILLQDILEIDTAYHMPTVIEPINKSVRVGSLGSNSQGNRIYSITGKAVTLSANGGGMGAKTGLYAIPLDIHEEQNVAILQLPHGYNKGGIKYNKAPTLTANGSWQTNNFIIEKANGTHATVYVVKNGFITYREKQYPINLTDGYYIIRKLTPIECERLQTLPDDYTAGISDTQRYKCLGNGWTAEVIIHILKSILKDIPRSEKLLVLSMYDGIATGRYCLEQLGFTDNEYYAYEIDKYAKQVAMKNYPNIIQHGDAFEVRNSEWRIYE